MLNYQRVTMNDLGKFGFNSGNGGKSGVLP
jgi:hypothetical protein